MRTAPDENDLTGTIPEGVRRLLDSAECRVGLAARRLPDEEVFACRGDSLFTQASAIKTPIVWELYRAAEAGELSLEEAIAINPDDGAGGCGILQRFSSGATRIALGDLAVMMIVMSDNVATNLLIERVSIDAVNRLLERLGMRETRLRRKMMDFPAREAGLENTSTPLEALALMSELHKRFTAGDPIAARVAKTLRLKKEGPVTEALPKEATLINKPGMLDRLRTDWSIVEQDGVAYAMTLMVDDAEDEVLKQSLRELSLAVHQSMIG